jgi:hypothetical protein
LCLDALLSQQQSLPSPTPGAQSFASAGQSFGHEERD